MSGNKLRINESEPVVQDWSFLTKHAQVLLCIGRDPEIRLRDISISVNLTERRVQSILSDLIMSGYVAKAKSGRRNRYEIRERVPRVDVARRQDALVEIIKVLRISNRP